MSTLLIETVPLAMSVEVTEDELIVSLDDGRRISAPLAWFPRLLGATPEARAEFRFLGGGEGIHWPQVDEDISVAGLLRGAHPLPANRDAQRGTRYRRSEAGGTWHWCTDCSRFPGSDYFVRDSRPAGELCNECVIRTEAGHC